MTRARKVVRLNYRQLFLQRSRKYQHSFFDLIPSAALWVNQVMTCLDFMICTRLTKPFRRRCVRIGGTTLSRLP